MPQRSYGRRGPDPDKHLFEAFRTTTQTHQLPENQSYEYLFGPIRDQEQAGTCCAFAPAGLVDAFLTKRMKPAAAPLISPAALYSMTKHLREPDNMQEQGLYAQDVLWVLQNVGYVLESDRPYNDNPNYILEAVPDNIIHTDHKIKSFKRVGGSEMGSEQLIQAILLALFDEGPQTFGIQFQYDWENVGPDGILNPNPTMGAAGGHEMDIVGASMTRRALRIRNQWGDGWADKGYAWLSFDSKVLPDDSYSISI